MTHEGKVAGMSNQDRWHDFVAGSPCTRTIGFSGQSPCPKQYLYVEGKQDGRGYGEVDDAWCANSGEQGSSPGYAGIFPVCWYNKE